MDLNQFGAQNIWWWTKQFGIQIPNRPTSKTNLQNAQQSTQEPAPVARNNTPNLTANQSINNDPNMMSTVKWPQPGYTEDFNTYLQRKQEDLIRNATPVKWPIDTTKWFNIQWLQAIQWVNGLWLNNQQLDVPAQQWASALNDTTTVPPVDASESTQSNKVLTKGDKTQATYDLAATIASNPSITPDELKTKFPEFKGNEQSMYDLAATIKSNPDITTDEIKTKFPELVNVQKAWKDKNLWEKITSWWAPTDDKSIAKQATNTMAWNNLIWWIWEWTVNLVKNTLELVHKFVWWGLWWPNDVFDTITSSLADKANKEISTKLDVNEKSFNTQVWKIVPAVVATLFTPEAELAWAATDLMTEMPALWKLLTTIWPDWIETLSLAWKSLKTLLTSEMWMETFTQATEWRNENLLEAWLAAIPWLFPSIWAWFKAIAPTIANRLEIAWLMTASKLNSISDRLLDEWVDWAKDVTASSVGKVLLDNWVKGSKSQIAEQTATLAEKSKQAVDDILSKSETLYKNDTADKLLTSLEDEYKWWISTANWSKLARVQELMNKSKNEWLTLTELNEVKRMIRDLKPFTATWKVKVSMADLSSANSELKTFIENKAEESIDWLEKWSIKILNNRTQFFNAVSDAVTKRESSITAQRLLNFSLWHTPGALIWWLAWYEWWKGDWRITLAWAILGWITDSTKWNSYLANKIADVFDTREITILQKFIDNWGKGALTPKIESKLEGLREETTTLAMLDWEKAATPTTATPATTYWWPKLIWTPEWQVMKEWSILEKPSLVPNQINNATSDINNSSDINKQIPGWPQTKENMTKDVNWTQQQIDNTKESMPSNKIVLKGDINIKDNKIPENLLWNEQRKQIAQKWQNVLDIIKKESFAKDIKNIEIVGSFATNKEIPGDIDMLIYLNKKSEAADMRNTTQVFEQNQDIRQKIDKQVHAIIINPDNIQRADKIKQYGIDNINTSKSLEWLSNIWKTTTNLKNETTLNDVVYKQYIDKWLKPNEIKAINDYVISPKAIDAKNITNWLNKLDSYKWTVYRWDDKAFIIWNKDIGDIVTTDRLVSTELNKNYYNTSPVKYEIKSINWKDLWKLNNNNEVLFDKWTKFKINNIVDNKDWTKIIKLEEVTEWLKWKTSNISIPQSKIVMKWDVLYHTTWPENVDSIMKEWLKISDKWTYWPWVYLWNWKEYALSNKFWDKTLEIQSNFKKTLSLKSRDDFLSMQRDSLKRYEENKNQLKWISENTSQRNWTAITQKEWDILHAYLKDKWYDSFLVGDNGIVVWLDNKNIKVIKPKNTEDLWNVSNIIKNNNFEWKTLEDISKEKDLTKYNIPEWYSATLVNPKDYNRYVWYGWYWETYHKSLWWIPNSKDIQFKEMIKDYSFWKLKNWDVQKDIDNYIDFYWNKWYNRKYLITNKWQWLLLEPDTQKTISIYNKNQKDISSWIWEYTYHWTDKQNLESIKKNWLRWNTIYFINHPNWTLRYWGGTVIRVKPSDIDSTLGEHFNTKSINEWSVVSEYWYHNDVNKTFIIKPELLEYSLDSWKTRKPMKK